MKSNPYIYRQKISIEQEAKRRERERERDLTGGIFGQGCFVHSFGLKESWGLRDLKKRKEKRKTK